MKSRTKRYSPKKRVTYKNRKHTRKNRKQTRKNKKGFNRKGGAFFSWNAPKLPSNIEESYHEKDGIIKRTTGTSLRGYLMSKENYQTRQDMKKYHNIRADDIRKKREYAENDEKKKKEDEKKMAEKAKREQTAILDLSKQLLPNSKDERSQSGFSSITRFRDKIGLLNSQEITLFGQDGLIQKNDDRLDKVYQSYKALLATTGSNNSYQPDNRILLSFHGLLEKYKVLERFMENYHEWEKKNETAV